MKKVSVLFDSIVNPCDGYGSSAEQMAIALSKNKFVSDLFFKPHDGVQNIDMLQPETKTLLSEGSEADIYLGYYQPPIRAELNDYAKNAKRKYLYTTWETDTPPVLWKDYINLYDKLFVSCSMCEEGFRKIGVDIPISIVPLGVNESLWPYKKRSLTNRPLRFLVFVNAHWSNPRKNISMAFQAFKEAFGTRDDVELWLKVTNSTGLPPAIE